MSPWLIIGIIMLLLILTPYILGGLLLIVVLCVAPFDEDAPFPFRVAGGLFWLIILMSFLILFFS